MWTELMNSVHMDNGTVFQSLWFDLFGLKINLCMSNLWIESMNSVHMFMNYVHMSICINNLCMFIYMFTFDCFIMGFRGREIVKNEYLFWSQSSQVFGVIIIKLVYLVKLITFLLCIDLSTFNSLTLKYLISVG